MLHEDMSAANPVAGSPVLSFHNISAKRAEIHEVMAYY